MKPITLKPAEKRSTMSRTWGLLLLLAGLLFVAFIVASVDLFRTAISSQPDCVVHERLGTINTGQLRAPAAKSAC